MFAGDLLKGCWPRCLPLLWTDEPWARAVGGFGGGCRARLARFRGLSRRPRRAHRRRCAPGAQPTRGAHVWCRRARGHRSRRSTSRSPPSPAASLAGPVFVAFAASPATATGPTRRQRWPAPALIVALHHDNIARLRAGTERKLGQGGERRAEPPGHAMSRVAVVGTTPGARRWPCCWRATAMNVTPLAAHGRRGDGACQTDRAEQPQSPRPALPRFAIRHRRRRGHWRRRPTWSCSRCRRQHAGQPRPPAAFIQPGTTVFQRRQGHRAGAVAFVCRELIAAGGVAAGARLRAFRSQLRGRDRRRPARRDCRRGQRRRACRAGPGCLMQPHASVSTAATMSSAWSWAAP